MSEPKVHWLERGEQVAEMAAALKSEKVIGVDTEFIREKTFFPQIALIQVGNATEIWLLDPTRLSEQDLAPFVELLTDPDILKVFHAAFADQECLYWAYGVVAAPILDTAVAAALLGMGDNLGLGKLVKSLNGTHLPKGRARAKWLARPLPEELMRYAASDVEFLIEMTDKLESRLREKDRWEWALEESVVPIAAFDTPPESIAARIGKSGSLDKASQGALLELVRWREARAKEIDIPRNWVADNETLRSLAKAKPRSQSELEQFRGLKGREVSRQGKVILTAIANGINGPAPEFPRSQRGPIPSDEEERAADLVKTYTNYLADNHSVATRYLMSGGDFLRLLRTSPENWVERGILSHRAHALIGEELGDFLSGRRGLSLKEGRVHISKLS